MEIKVGEYVRSYLGTIGKVTRIENDGLVQLLYEDGTLITTYKFVVKHSFNILDLIEVGDVINYKELFDNPIFEIQANETHIINLNSQKEVNGFKMLVEDKEIEIVSIVTKEQFTEMEYKV